MAWNHCQNSKNYFLIATIQYLVNRNSLTWANQNIYPNINHVDEAKFVKIGKIFSPQSNRRLKITGPKSLISLSYLLSRSKECKKLPHSQGRAHHSHPQPGSSSTILKKKRKINKTRRSPLFLFIYNIYIYINVLSLLWG